MQKTQRTFTKEFKESKHFQAVDIKHRKRRKFAISSEKMIYCDRSAIYLKKPSLCWKGNWGDCAQGTVEQDVTPTGWSVRAIDTLIFPPPMSITIWLLRTLVFSIIRVDHFPPDHYRRAQRSSTRGFLGETNVEKPARSCTLT
jgi:hypothetical protein